MEAVIFVGIQASGKSTFYKQNFYSTHMRINLDMLKTRKREDIFLDACINTRQPFVVDNMNLTPEDRGKYLDMAKNAGFKIVCYHFETDIKGCLRRNEQRSGKARIPAAAIMAASKKLVIPVYDEGFDIIYKVNITENNMFAVEEIKNVTDC